MKKYFKIVFYLFIGAVTGIYIYKNMEVKKRKHIPVESDDDYEYDIDIVKEFESEDRYKEIPNDYANMALCIISHLEENVPYNNEINRFEHICDSLNLDKLTPLGKIYVMNIVIKESTRGFFFVNYCKERWNDIADSITEIKDNNDKYMKTKWEIENQGGKYQFRKINDAETLFTVNVEEENERI